ncbi:MAG: hypothetical protein SA339_05815 [Methanomassiliicoccus sp.]|nr:hypothetical protein [Methanomassiliicoccus sp.]
MLRKEMEEGAKARTTKVLLGTVSALVVTMFVLNFVITPVSANVDYAWNPDDSRYDFSSFSNWDVQSGQYRYTITPTPDASTGVVHMNHEANAKLGASGAICGTAGFVTPSNEHYFASSTGTMTLKAVWRIYDNEHFNGVATYKHISQKIFCNIHDITAGTWYYSSNPTAYTVSEHTSGSNWLVDGTYTWQNPVPITANHEYEIKSWISVYCEGTSAVNVIAEIEMSGSYYADLNYVGLYN